MAGFKDLSASLGGNVTMRARHYRGGTKTPVLCIHGLTRNAADFEDLAPQIAGTGRDVFVLSLRGRGLSDYDPHYQNYFPTTYRDDAIKALDAFDCERAIFIGTSLGGITTMLVNAHSPARVAGAIINDVGPDLAPEGIERIAGYVGKTSGVADTLDEAAAQIRLINRVAFPDASDDDWIKFARRTFRKTDDGKWVLDYDPNIALALAEAGPAPDLWPAWNTLHDKPTLLVRGAISDLLTPPIVEKMRETNPGFDYVEVPRVGHAPMLTEPAAWSAIKAFLNRFD